MLNSLLKRFKKSVPTDNYYRSLMKSMFLIGVVVPLMPMVLVSGIILYQFQVSYKKEVQTHLKEVVQKGKKSIDHFLKEKLADISILADTFSFEQFSDESFLEEILKNLQANYGPVFSDLGVINGEGFQVGYAGPIKSAKTRYSEADWYHEVMNTGHVISDVSSGLRNIPHFNLAVRKDWMGKHWVLRAIIDREALNRVVDGIGAGKTGAAFIINRDGEYQTGTLHSIHPGKETSMDFLGINEKGKSETSIVQRTNGSGNKNIYVTTFLKEGDWVLVYHQRVSEAFSGLRKIKTVALAVILMVSLLIGANALSLSKKMVRRIEQADKEKQKLNEQMFQTGKLASIGELAAGIAHEINNPVAIMVEEAGWIDDLLEEEEFHEGKNLNEFRRALQQIQIQGKRCKEITHKLLSFARKTDHKVQEVHIDKLIEDIIAISEKRAKYQWISIHTDIQKDLPSIEASENELQQVLLNLINNALDAMEKKGGTLSISAQLKKDNIVIDISDEGPGIPEDIISRIFDPFFTTKPFGKGTGLGLSISYGIVKKLGGEISVESVTDVGSKFRIMIPLSKDKGKDVKNPPTNLDSHVSTGNLI
ncbi:MAG: two-component sensor histidine kinase [Desulfobacteraceae bacterium]|nr:two-component sensor histidine kinase [Desulfobacteraceae bacterium]